MATVYNIPVDLLAAYRGRKVIVRAQEPADLVRKLGGCDLDDVVAVNLLSMTADVNPLASWGEALPIELVMLSPQNQFPFLYRHAKLLDKHPVRVCISAVPGFSKAVKLAASLQFFIKLEVGQPDEGVIDELHELVEFYLHNPSVSNPIEFFHSTILNFYHGESETLWEIQEDDPAGVCYITDDGHQILNRRSSFTTDAPYPDEFVAKLQQRLFSEGAECMGCEFFYNCGGYFKWPRTEYDCSGIRTVFRSLKLAADELKRELAPFSEPGTAARR